MSVIFRISLLIIFLFASPGFSIAAIPVKGASSNLSDIQKIQDSENETQIKLLKSELDLRHSFESSMLSTVYWSLAGILTVMVVMVGYSWFTNFKLYERDKEAIINDLNLKFLTESNSLKQSHQSEMSELHTNLKSMIDGELRVIKKLTNDQITENITSVEKSVKSINKNFETFKHETKSELLELNRNHWLSLAVYRNAIGIDIQLFDREYNLHRSEWKLDKYLSYIYEDLTNLKSKSSSILASDLLDLNNIIIKAPVGHSIVVDKIRVLLTTIQTI